MKHPSHAKWRRQIIRRRPRFQSGCRNLFEQPPHCEQLRLSLATVRFVLVYRKDKILLWFFLFFFISFSARKQGGGRDFFPFLPSCCRKPEMQEGADLFPFFSHLPLCCRKKEMLKRKRNNMLALSLRLPGSIPGLATHNTTKLSWCTKDRLAMVLPEKRELGCF